MGERSAVAAMPSRSQLLLVLDRTNFGIEDSKRRWVLHDLLLKVARSFDERSGISTVYLGKKDRYTLADAELGSKFQRVWQQGPSVGKDASFTLTATFIQEVQRRMQQAAQHL